MLKAFLFDRDGVVIKNYGYFCDKKKIKWLKGSIQAIKILNTKKIKVIIITNQSGIGRGYFTEKKLLDFHNSMNFFLKKKKAKIDKFYYCPFHPLSSIKKYKKKTNMRKPGNGMILKALRHYKIKAENCFMIGDQRSDYLSAKKTNIDFEYKKKYRLDLQIKKILKSKNI